MQDHVELSIDEALWPVACRAFETGRTTRLLNDPYASYLAAGRGDELFRSETDGLHSFIVAVGAATVDDMLQHAIGEHHVHTVVNLGAGLDTRPYRLELPSDLRWIEADHARILAYKSLRLAHVVPRCQVRRFGVNLHDASGRRNTLLAMARDVTRGLVLTEGLSTSWTRAALDDLLEHLPSVFRYWIVDTIAWRRTGSPRPANAGQPASLCPHDVVEAFECRGWQSTEFRALEDQALRLGGDRTADFLGELEGVWLFRQTR
jgi:O-methyltransferase involved in polyketide biosynthesis